MANLRFDIEELKPLVEHALSCKEHRLTYAMMFDPLHHKDGVKLAPKEFPNESHIDKSKAKPALMLVKDNGVYLMSSGLPFMPGATTTVHVVYAKGLGQGTHGQSSKMLGGDDFMEAIPIDGFVTAIAEGRKSVHIDMSQDRFSVEFDPARPSYTRAERVAAEAACGGVSAKPKWAEPGKTYKGAIFGFDSKVVFQKSGRGLIIHEKDLLDWQPQKGDMVSISYSADPLERAQVAVAPLATIGRSRPAGPSM